MNNKANVMIVLCIVCISVVYWLSVHQVDRHVEFNNGHVKTVDISKEFKNGHVKTVDFSKEFKNGQVKTVDFSNEFKNGHVKTVDFSKDIYKLIKTARAIEQALIHSKSLKSRKALKTAKEEISDLLHIKGLNYKNVTSRVTHPPKSVCPEVYKGTLHGFHLWNTGFVETNCSYKQELKDLITIILIRKKSIDLELPTIYKDLKIIVSSLNVYQPLKTKNPSFKFITHSSSTSAGEVWNRLLEYVTTEYVLIARDIYSFDEHMRLDRLIRGIETLGVTVAAGAVRNKNGHWKMGCQQRAIRNYTLVYQDGYDESLKECVFCDHVEGSFVMQTKRAKHLAFDYSITPEGIFEDFFIRLGNEKSIVCPDSMFHVDRHENKTSWKEWYNFAKKWELFKIKFGKVDEIVFPCDTKIVCLKKISVSLTPCCLQIVSNMITLMSSLCVEYNAICEIDAGTLMGAIKMNKVLPWDIDADLIFTSSQYNILKTFNKKVKNAGYTIGMAEKPKPNKKFNNILDSGEFDVRSNGWTLELFGRWVLNSAKFIKDGKNQTKTNINGNWVVSPSNPGLYARNKYGKEIYKHVNHWRHLKYKHSYISYTDVGTFQKCVTPGHHNCLDQFNGDGNLQFDDPIP